MRSWDSAGTRFCSSASSSADLGRQQVDARGGDLAELDVHAAGLLEHAAQADPGGVDGALGPLGGGQERAEALLAAEADELAVAAQHRDAAADRPHRAGGDDEAGALAEGERARPGEQVEDDGRRHRRRDADGERGGRRARRRPSPSR